MKIKKLYVAALAAVMAIGGTASGLPANAKTMSTTLTLTVTEKNSYTMTIPSTIELNTDGSAKALDGGVCIKGDHMTRNVVVEMQGADGWKLSSPSATTKIGYAVYDAPNVGDSVDKIEFDKGDIMAADGATKTLYVKPDEEDVLMAEEGAYSGTITFTSMLKDVPLLSDALTTGSQFKLEYMDMDNKKTLVFEKTDFGFIWIEGYLDDDKLVTIPSEFHSAKVNESQIIVAYSASLKLTFDTENNQYSFSPDSVELISMSVKKAGKSEFVDCTSRLVKQ